MLLIWKSFKRHPTQGFQVAPIQNGNQFQPLLRLGAPLSINTHSDRHAADLCDYSVATHHFGFYFPHVYHKQKAVSASVRVCVHTVWLCTHGVSACTRRVSVHTGVSACTQHDFVCIHSQTMLNNSENTKYSCMGTTLGKHPCNKIILWLPISSSAAKALHITFTVVGWWTNKVGD